MRHRLVPLAIFALWLTVLTVADNFKTYFHGINKGDLEQPKVGMSSLTFVFDRTGSMFDDLDQVRKGTEGIFNTVMKQRKRFIYNYVLVMFHDPDVDEPLITTEPHRFQQKLRHVNLSGGQDCPEMTLTGIKKALEASLPGSFIYVFTDARSKDFHLIDSVLNLIQEKQSSVVFVMTGDCGDRDHEGYKVFDRIASASFGQVFHLQKSQVTQILEYVKHSMSQRKVHLLYEVRETGRSNTNDVPVDSHMSELALSLAITPSIEDKYLDLTVIDPNNKEHDVQSFLNDNTTINLNTVKLIRIKEPTPGIWKVKTSSRNRNTLRVFGHGAIDFKYGFTSVQNPNQRIELTQPRPYANQNSYLWVNMTGLDAPGVVERISMVDYEGREIYGGHATVARHNPALYYVGPFLPPKKNSFFFVRVEGVDNKDFKFVRIAPVATSSVEPGGPKASMLPITPATLYKSVNLTCTVESSGPFEVYWKHGDRKLTNSPLIFQHSDTATWPISVVTQDHAGRYICEVVSSSGNHSAYTDLDMFEPPPDIVSLRNATAVLGGQGLMHCQTQTHVPRFTWYRNGFPIPASPLTYSHPNGSLVIYNTKKEDAGPYMCKVETKGGTANATIYLSILETPTARISPKDIFVVENSYFQLDCETTGVPPPRVRWFHQGAPIDAQRSSTYVIDQNNNLRVYTGPHVKGIYECRADNVAGTVSDYSNVNIADKPVINIPREEYILGQGDNVVLKCEVLRGQPTPKIRWEKNGIPFTTEGSGSSNYIQQKYGNLHIKGASEVDAGEYTCIAENIAGRDSKTTKVNIGIPPNVISSPPKVEATIFKTTHLPCKALGNPPPTVAWYKNSVQVTPEEGRFSISSDGTLTIHNVQFDDSGIFVCRATNNYGSQDRSTQLFVVGLEAPVLGTIPPEMQVLEGDDVRIDCIVVMGIPPPERVWYKDGKPLYDSFRIFFDGDGSLVIRGASESDEGTYTCQAKNVVGTANQNVRLSLISKPQIEASKLKGDINVGIGQSVDLPCPATGNPKPKVAWLQNGLIIDTYSGEFSILGDNSLRIHKTSSGHSGVFTCKAVNAAGETEMDTVVRISSPPQIAPTQTSFNHIPGDSLVLPCEVDGEPKPEIQWFLNDRPAPGQIDNSGSLIIDNIDERHQGTYKCVAKNPSGQDEITMGVTVHTAPVIDDVSKTVVVNVNETAIFPCPARATPPPHRIWLYDGERIEIGPETAGIAEVNSDGSLVIKSVQMDHEGLYECHVSNLAGEDFVTYNLKVQQPPRIISDVPGTVDVVLGVGLEIPCRSVGTPKPQVSWQKNGFEVISNDEIVIDSGGTLRVPKVTLNDEGQYKCTVKNPAGEDTRLTNVVVQEPPKVMGSQNDEFTYIQGEIAVLKCDVKASPFPNFKWFRGDQEITSSTERHEINPDGSLFVSGIGKNDNVIYRCLATNAAGYVEVPMRLNVIIPPEITNPDIVDKESVRINDPFSLYCPVISHPLPQIYWQMNERPIVEGDSNIVFNDDKRRLRVLQSRITDAGIYKCIARNPAGESSKTFEVEILVPPQKDDSVHSTKISALEHQKVEFGCPVSGIPVPEIEWYVNMIPLKAGETRSGITVTSDGERILIEDTLVEHQGTFTCVATSKAGSLPIDIELSVIGKPQVGKNETIQAVIGKPTTLNCDVKNEGPKSSIIWLFNGKENLPEEAQLGPDSKKLIILDTGLQHAGIFECLVRNTAGESRKKFDLDVWMKPEFVNKNYDDSVQLISGEERRLDCRVSGNPVPRVEWKLDNRPIFGDFSSDGQILTIKHDESGRNRYTCVATNEVGSVFRDFVIDTISPPKLVGDLKSDDVIDVEVIQGHSATLDCPIESGQSSVTIEWLKNGHQIPQGIPKITAFAHGTRLSISDVQPEDEATFVCVATNAAGKASRNFRIKVFVPPRVQGSLVEEVAVVEGTELELQCLYVAEPEPEIIWTKDNGEIPDNVNLLNEQRSVYVEEVKKSDSGAYKCKLSNPAGISEKTFNVKVISKPVLLGSEETTVVEVLTGSPYTFECPISTDISDPSIELSWTKNKFPLLPEHYNQGMTVLSNGKHLHIPAVEAKNEGTFSCIAKNEAGETIKNYKLKVLVRPRILSPHGDFKVVENNTLVLPCEVEGSPEPSIEWKKNDEFAEKLPNVEILSNGQQFKILAAEEKHRGSYVCTAKNKVGKIDISFDVDVITRPTVAQQVKDVIEVIEGEKAHFDCEVNDRNFNGEITWMKNFEPILDLNKFTISKGNRKLIMNHAEIKDEASYSCRVRNDAGMVTVNYKLQVLVPPKIIILEKDKNKTVVENSSISLSCPATGKPEPSITWFKDGELVTKNNITNKIKSGKIYGNELRISRTMLVNAGTYTCEAKNKAGISDQDVILEVIIPPKIIRENISSEIEGKLNNYAEIQCPATGRPVPTVTWLKRGKPLDMARDVYLSGNQMRLHFTQLHKKHADKYTCIAKNAAGEDKRDFTLRLLEAPKIDSSNTPGEIQMNVGRTATLNCPASGSPEPKIHWIRDGAGLPNDGRFILLNSGKQLQIRNLEPSDSARFMCIAENKAGSSELSLDLKVIGAPEIKGPTVEEVKVLLNHPKELKCDVTGSAPISIEWLKGDRSVDSDTSGTGVYLQSTNQGQRMHILSAQKSDNTRFTCVARNAAGEVRKNFDVVVQIPPMINDSLSSASIQSVIPGSDFKIDCRVEAFPFPEISWIKDGIPVYPNKNVIFANENQTIYIKNAKNEDGGSYTCVTKNDVGSTSRKYLINLAAPPVFEQGTETRDVNVGDHVALTCRVSSGTGNIKIGWKINNRPANDGNYSQTVYVDGAKILINKIRFSDAGEYACIAQNEAGEARKYFFINVLEKPKFIDKTNTSISIIIGRPFTLECLVQGTPKPTVTWIKDGKVLDEETCLVKDNCQFMEDNQRLIIDEAGENDSGRYSCVAENLPGRDEKDIVVSLLRPPKMADERQQVEVAQGESSTLNCPIDDRSVQIQWFKDELPLRPNPGRQILNAGRTLHIMNAESSDSASYSCRAVNEAGDDTAYFDLLVLVKPEIIGPTLRTIESISNQTVPVHCRTTGIPPPSIEWFFGDQKIKPSNQYQIVENGTILKVHNIQGHQAGRYACVAKNKVGKTQADVFIEVTEPPVFDNVPNEIKVIEGQDKMIRCDVKGNPAPEVTWRKHGEPINYGIVSRGDNLIHIAKARVEDAGRYTCIAVNRAGERRHNIQVHVLVPPKIADGDRVLKAVEGNVLVLECPASGIPPPEISWLKNGIKLNAFGSSLTLSNLTVADATKYTCEARNEAGSTSADYVVDVFVKPRIREFQDEIRVIEGEKARLECKADGNPTPSVQWLRGGRKITDMHNFLLSPLGESLMILKAKTTDAGGYSCLAKNSAGETEGLFTVIVLTAPYLNEAIDQNPKVITGKSTTLYCPVRGNPPPEVTWKFNGEELNIDGVQYSKDPVNNNLEIKSAQGETAGRYTCHAVNEVNYLDTEYVLDVIAPPKFASSGQKVYEVLVGDPITMTCPLEATPQPEITWLRAGNPIYLSSNIDISPDGQKLTIKKAILEDNGKYTCNATNVAGTTDIDVLLKVYVPPTIDESNLIGNPLAVLGKSIYLECPADGIPQPTVTWMRNGRPIPLGGRYIVQQNNITFGILNVTAEDVGKYSCIAENKGGKAEEHFDLHVLAPPELTSKEPQKITRREGDEISLICPVKQVVSVDPNEERDITWTKDGRSLGGTSLSIGLENGNGAEKSYTISKDGYRLTISNLKLADAGDYRCLVTNRAGEVHGRFIVETLSKPTIDASRNPPEAHVIQGRPYTIHCPASGHPMPIIRWFKDKHPVDPEKDKTVRVLDGGQGLEILKADTSHKGLWTCEAENDAGDSEIDVRLDVWTLPEAAVRPGKEGPVRPLGSSVTLFCDPYGNPAPIVTWKFEGRVLIHSPDGTQISEGNKRLDIPNLKLEDAGEYTCSVKNEVGTHEDNIEVDILVPSKIERDGVQLSQRVPTGQTLTLFCDVKGKPLPKLSWFINDTLIEDQFENVKIGEGGEYIEVTNVSLADKGIYKCVASNAAGNDTLDFKVDIDQKPQILNSGTAQTLEGKVAVLVCNATGEPSPKITWLRNGMRLETNVRYMIDKNTLKIVDTRSDSDSGIYLCMAQNEAGSVQQAFTLEVMVSPEIVSASPNETVIAVGEPFRLKCGARGHPKPAVTWEINDEKIETALTTEYKLEDDYLYVKELPQKGTSVFRCTVHNAAGLDEIEYVVKAIAPPTVNKEGVQTINITENDPTVIFCDIEVDLKDSEIFWMKDGAPIGGDPQIEIKNGKKQLKIPKTLLKDEGTYTCTARNSAGNATLTTKLYVGVPPKINEELRKIIVKKGAKAELLCEAVGIPPPQITWLKDNQTLMHTPVADSKTTAVFDEVQPEQAGVYTCKATNWAGTVYKDVDFLVLIPPEIDQEKINATGNLGDTVILPCNATGIPEPVISWMKVPDIDIIGKEEKYQVMGSALAIKNLSIEDDGYYHCIAKSDAGQAIAMRKVTVQLPFKGSKTLWVECNEKGEPIDSIFKQARGDLPESDKVLDHWENRPNRIILNGTDGTVIMCLPQRSARTLEKNVEVAPQFVEEPPSVVRIRIGDDLRLRCGAVGPPTPEVYFTKNGEILEETRNPENTEIRKIANSEDFGTYHCFAINSVGEGKVEFVVEEDNSTFVSRENPELQLTILNCLKNSKIQKKHVIWKLDGNSVNNLDDSMHPMNNGSLVLSYFAMKLDLDRISCIVDGESGDGFDAFYTTVNEEVPIVKIKPTKIFSHPDSDIVVGCHLKRGNPLTTRIKWTKENVNLAPDGDKIQVLPDNSLLIKNALQTDRGSFKCRGWNSRGKSWDGVDLIVEDAPNTLNTKIIRGKINDKDLTFGQLLLPANFTPNTKSNDISVTIDNLAGDHTTVTRSIMAVVAVPLPVLGFDPSESAKPVKKRPAKFERITDYQFESGEKMRVKQKSKGIQNDALDLDVELDGRLPTGRTYDAVEFEPWEEDLVEDSPGHVVGTGHSALKFGAGHRVPFRWTDEINFEDEDDEEFVGRGETMKVFAQPSYHDDNIKIETKVGRFGRCPEGFTKLRDRCRDIDECSIDPEICAFSGNNSVCVNYPGYFECQTFCAEGFRSDSEGQCVDVDECKLGISDCEIGQECVNSEGSFECQESCAGGYQTDNNGICVDVDECLGEPCELPTTCKNLQGTFACVCPAGFPSINGSCEGILIDPNHPLKVLDYAIDRHNCPNGYYWKNGLCEDIGECEFDAPCAHRCTNLPGGFRCDCPEGYVVGENGVCVDVDECKIENNCLENELCFNEFGSYSCLSKPCPRRFRLDKSSMQCIPICRNCSDSPINLHMLPVRSGLESETPLIRLTAHDKTGRILRKSSFRILTPTEFFLQADSAGSATVFNKYRLLAGSRHQIGIKSDSISNDRKIKYKTDFLVFVSVSQYPF